jgi:hypothetical protein
VPAEAMIVRSVISASEFFQQRAEWQDAQPQPELLADPEAVLEDEAGFVAWAAGKDGNKLELLEAFFRERTGVLVCAVFPNGFAYRPRHHRDAKGVWHSWGKLPKWFKRLYPSACW